MKGQYESLEMEIIEFDSEDVIQTSEPTNPYTMEGQDG